MNHKQNVIMNFIMNQEGQQQESTNHVFYPLPKEEDNYFTCYTQVP